MKRSEFAKKHDLTYDTIRHYIEIGLLAPKLQGSHYYFGEGDSNDIETILQLKQLDFTLPEIQSIMTIERAIDKNSIEYVQLLLPLYEDKLQSVEMILKRYSDIKHTLKNEIGTLKRQTILSEETNNPLGFPMSSFELLACPRCNNTLNVSNGKLEQNSIIHAEIDCACGYHAMIQDSIYIGQQTNKQKLLKDGIKFPSLNEYLQVVSPKYINFQFTAMSDAVKMIQKHSSQPKTMLELNFCIGQFLNKYKHALHFDTTYILVDYDLERIKASRNKLATETNHKKFMFICCDIDSLPIKKASIDLIIDDWMPKCYVPSNKQSITEEILPYLKDNGLLVGFYHYIDNQAKNKSKLPPNVIAYYDHNKLLQQFSKLQLGILESTDIGPITEYNPYNSDVKNAEIYQTVYIASRKGTG